MLKHLIFFISIIQIIFSENVDNEDQEDRRNLSTDILDYVLKELNYEWKITSDPYDIYFLLFIHSLDQIVQRGEDQNDQTIASDILGFVKKRIDSSDVEDVSPEILKYVLEESEDPDSDNSTTETTETGTEDPQDEVVIEGEFVEAEEESCSPSNDVVFQILDTKSYSMSNEVATDNSSAIIKFQQVDVEGETKVNFGKWSSPRCALI